MQSKILIVEEQSKTTDKISAQLEENGYWTDICHSTDELFSTFKAGAYVLMILDLSSLTQTVFGCLKKSEIWTIIL